MSLDNARRPVGHVDWDGGVDDAPVPLSAEQARSLLERHPQVSPWWVVRWQLIVGAGFGLFLALVAWRWSLAWSAWYGAVALALPSALQVRGMRQPAWQHNATLSLVGFFLWEGVKVGGALLLIALAPRLVKDLSWSAMLAGLFVAMQVHLMALLVKRR